MPENGGVTLVLSDSAHLPEPPVEAVPPLAAILEAYLLVAAEPVRAEDIARSLDLPSSTVQASLEELFREYDRRAESGIRLQRLAGGYQLCTRPDAAPFVAKLLALPKDRARLSKPALETVAVIAYQQPTTQAEIEAVRGVSADGVVKTLLERRLIQEAGRKPVPGRPILYATTPEFLHYFGLHSLDDLPPLEDVEPALDDASKQQALEAVGLEHHEN